MKVNCLFLNGNKPSVINYTWTFVKAILSVVLIIGVPQERIASQQDVGSMVSKLKGRL